MISDIVIEAELLNSYHFTSLDPIVKIDWLKTIFLSVYLRNKDVSHFYKLKNIYIYFDRVLRELMLLLSGQQCMLGDDDGVEWLMAG